MDELKDIQGDDLDQLLPTEEEMDDIRNALLRSHFPVPDIDAEWEKISCKMKDDECSLADDALKDNDDNDDASALKPTIVLSAGATVEPNSEVVQDFKNNVVKYTVTGPDGGINVYYVVVTVKEPSTGGGGTGGGTTEEVACLLRQNGNMLPRAVLTKIQILILEATTATRCVGMQKLLRSTMCLRFTS